MKRNKTIEKLLSTLDDAKVQAEGQMNSLQETFDNKSEKWQEGEKGEEMSNAISALEECVSSIESAMNEIESNFELE